MADDPDGRRQNLRLLAFVVMAVLFYLGVRVVVGKRAEEDGRGGDAAHSAALASRSGVPAALAAGMASAAAHGSEPTDPVIYAEVESREATAPPRFAAALPNRVEDLAAFYDDDARFPPPAHVMDLICLGDADMQHRFDVALRAASEASTTPSQLVEAYGRMVESCDGGGTCEWAKRCLDAKPPVGAGTVAVAWHALARCEGEDISSRFERRDAPSVQLVEFWSRASEPAPYSARLERAVENVIGTGTVEDVRRAAFVLGATDHPRAAAALLDLQSETDDPERAREIALAMYRQSDPRARAAFARACERRPNDPVCRAPRGPTQAAAGVDAGSDSQGSTHRGDPTALRRCVETETRAAEQYACLVELSTVEREAAEETMGGPLGLSLSSSPHAHLAELAVTVRRYPERESLLRRLGDLGLLRTAEPLEAAGTETPGVLTARQALRAAHRILEFDAETDEYPNHHDSLLRRLAAIAGPPLAAVLFAEEAPAQDDRRAYYRLSAYPPGKEVSATARNLGDYYDVAAVVGLLNVLARQLGTDLRFVVLGTTDQIASVVVGPEAALRTLVSEGLLTTAAPDQAMANGRAAEAQAPGAMP